MCLRRCTFSGTIASNLRYGKDDATNAQIEEAASIAQATEFIDSKSAKYDSPIAQGGTNVSGGQKQRLSIARAIAKDPKIYIFDDSFSALDLKTDAALRKALSSKVKDSTVIIVAQRISTILHADQILVMDEGRIVGKGTHGELMNSCDVYQQIARSQDVSKRAWRGGIIMEDNKDFKTPPRRGRMGGPEAWEWHLKRQKTLRVQFQNLCHILEDIR